MSVSYTHLDVYKRQSEDTSTVLRDGGIDGNKIRKNSRNIGKFAETRVHIVVSSLSLIHILY